VKKNLPVVSIGDFRHFSRDHDFYAERLLPHIQLHDFTNRPHKHDFFLVVLFTHGTGTHEVDFTRYKIRPGTVFFLNPGQSHHWILSKDIDGLIFFHTRDFFDKEFTRFRLRDYPFFSSINNPPFLQLKKKDIPVIKSVFQNIKEEYADALTLKEEKILSLVNLLYVELTRRYVPNFRVKSENYLSRLSVFEDLVEKHFIEIKFPSAYAALMNITERHLNRISKTCLGKTSSEMILDRIILEAKRLLMRTDTPIAEIAEQLGYADNSYFSRLFKKRTGLSPKKFAKNYK